MEQKSEAEWLCKYCGKIYFRKSCKTKHEAHCDLNPNGLPYKKKQYRKTDQRYAIIDGKRKLISGTAWNKGLTDQTDVRLKHSHDTLREGYKSGRIKSIYAGKTLPDETKQKISITMKQFCIEHPDRVPYVLNHHQKGDSYPERYFKHIFSAISIPYNKDMHVCGYFLDFAWEHAKCYVEIDGEQHYVDKRIIDHDIIRTQHLEAAGWTCIQRVRWSTYRSLGKEQRKNFIKNLIATINSAIIV